MTLEGSLVDATPMRAAIARRMVESKQQAPHFYVSTEIEMDGVLAGLEALKEELPDTRVTTTAALVRASARALAQHPRLNSVWTEEGLLQAKTINVCVAVALDGGLIAPALLGAGPLGIVETAEQLTDLVARARGRKLRPPELSDGTFTVSNLGMYPVSSFTAIVTPPQVGILATGRTMRRFVPGAGDEPRAVSVLTATLSADHRAVDGADAAAFLDTLKRTLEAPGALLERDQSREEATA